MSVDRTPEIQAKYEKRKKELEGKCPFCECKEERIETFDNYFLIRNGYPYKETETHWLLIPYRYIENFSEENEDEQKEFNELKIYLEEKYPKMELRVKFKENKWRSVKHLHYHLIID